MMSGGGWHSGVVTDFAAETRRWVEAATGVGVVAAEPLVGGVSSVIHRCRLTDGRDVVARHIDDAAWLAREPYLVAAEATALTLARRAGLPVPQLLAADEATGRLLMSFLPGRPLLDEARLASSVGRMAALAASVAAVELPPQHDLPAWRPWRPVRLASPTWGSHQLWARAIAAYEARPPAGPHGGSPHRAALLHRDLHPLNLLWTDGRLSGVVDWVNACVGHPHAELYHARFNLAVLGGLARADEFLAEYLRRTAADDSGPYDPRWDVETPVSLLDAPPDGSSWRALGRSDLTDARILSAIETFVAATLADL